MPAYLCFSFPTGFSCPKSIKILIQHQRKKNEGKVITAPRVDSQKSPDETSQKPKQLNIIKPQHANMRYIFVAPLSSIIAIPQSVLSLPCRNPDTGTAACVL
jgi:hypothetical protein